MVLRGVVVAVVAIVAAGAQVLWVFISVVTVLKGLGVVPLNDLAKTQNKKRK